MSGGRRDLDRALEAARAAERGGRARERATQLRAAWRLSKSPRIAALYELTLARDRAAPLAGRDPSERAAGFRARAEAAPGDPLLLPVLLDEPWNPALPELERLRIESAWGPDPLLAAACARRLRVPHSPPEQPGWLQIAVETVRLIAAQHDPRQLDTLQTLAREPGLGSELRRQLRGAIASLEAVKVVRLLPSTEALLAALEPRAREQRAILDRTAALLEAVHADPDADAPRLIYADWLTSRGDPRGELITLQLQRAGSDRPPSDRELELLERHADAWAGDLHAVLGTTGRVFARGFLASASIEVGKLDGEIIERGEWATLRTLDGHVPELLAARGRLDHLRTLYGFLDLERFVAMRAAGRLGAVETYECSLADPNLRFDTPLGLRALLVRRVLDDQLIALLGTPACAGLEEIAVYYDGGGPDGGGPASWTGDHRERPRLRARYDLLCTHASRHIRRLRMLDGRTSRASRPVGCTLSFERDELGEFGRLRIDLRGRAGTLDERRRRTEALVELLETLPLDRLSQLTLGTLGTLDGQAYAREQLVDALALTGVLVMQADAGDRAAR